MKTKSSFLFLTIFLTVFGSCDRGTESTSFSAEALANYAVSSTKFANLNVPISKLEINSVKFTNEERNAILIPVIASHGREGIIAFFTSENKLKTVIHFEAKAFNSKEASNFRLAPGDSGGSDEPQVIPTGASDVEIQLANDTFYGELIFDEEQYRITYQFEKSVAIGQQALVKPTSTAKCGPLSSPGGALDCAGKAITQMKPIAKTRCYLTFIACLAWEVADCLLTDCE